MTPRRTPVLDLWRSTPLTLDSALPPEEVRARMRQGVEDYPAARRALGFGERLIVPRDLEVRGYVVRDSFGLRGVRPMSRGSGVGYVSGRVVPEGAGSRLLGRVGFAGHIRVVFAVLLVLVASFAVGGVFIVASSGLSGLAVVAVALVMFGFGLGLVKLLVGQGRVEQAFVLGWLRERLDPDIERAALRPRPPGTPDPGR